jgi:hypothetical protein
MRGEIEHLGTGERRFFPNHGSLLALIETWRQEIEPARIEPAR